MFHLRIHIEIATATVGKQEAGGGCGANDAFYGIDRVFHTAQHLGDGGGDRACRSCMIGNGSAVFTVTEGIISADSHNGNGLAVAELYGGFCGGFGFAAVNVAAFSTAFQLARPSSETETVGICSWGATVVVVPKLVVASGAVVPLVPPPQPTNKVMTRRSNTAIRIRFCIRTLQNVFLQWIFYGNLILLYILLEGKSRGDAHFSIA